MERFVEEECIPGDAIYHAQLGEGEQRWKGHPSIIDDLKKRAKELGLWNLFLPRNHFKEGAGFSNLEYGLMAEWLGKSRVASEVCVLTTNPGMGGAGQLRWTNALSGNQLRCT